MIRGGSCLVLEVAESDITLMPSVTWVGWLRWWCNHATYVVPPATALTFVTKMSEKRRYVSPSAVQVKDWQKTVSTKEKSDVISQLEKG